MWIHRVNQNIRGKSGIYRSKSDIYLESEHIKCKHKMTWMKSERIWFNSGTHHFKFKSLKFHSSSICG